MNVELLAALREALDDLSEQQQTYSTLIEEYMEDIRRAEEKLQSAEDERTQYELLRAQLVRKSELLREYITRLGTQPRALLKRVEQLEKDQQRIYQCLREAETSVANALSFLQMKQRRLAEVEQHAEDIREQWSEVSKHLQFVEAE